MALATILSVCAVVALLQSGPAAAQEDVDYQMAKSAINATQSPTQKVVTLLTEMKSQVEKDATADQEAYDKYKCWCETNEKEKTEAIAVAQERIASLEAFMEEAAAKEAELKTDIEALEQDIQEDQDALATAAAIREKEHAEYEAATADMKESISALSQAVAVLAKVQLVQKDGKMNAAALVQVRNKVHNILKDRFHSFPHYKSVMQQDLFDVLGSLEGTGAFLPKRQTAALEQNSGSALPWEVSEEEAGMAAKPNDLVGAAAGAKSYNSRSGSIYGMLQQMQETFQKDLNKAEEAEQTAQAQFEELKSAKEAEIAAAKKQKFEKEQELAELLKKAAEAKGDLEATKRAMQADQEFLVTLRKNCKVVDEEYAARASERSKEILALGETLEILTSDESRDLFGRTGTFLQIASDRSSASTMRQRMVQKVMKRIAKVAKKHHNWILASLAVRVQLDSFTKVKEMMDKMVQELKAQQKAEYEKNEFCKKAIDETEDKIKEETREKEDLADKHLGLTNALEALTEDIKNLKAEVAENEVSLKKAGEDRKAENGLYQTEVADQRACINILNLAYNRLKQFYAPSADGTVGMLVQVHAHQPEPGADVAPPPPKPKGYSKHGTAGGVLQLVAKIIQDAEVEEQSLVQSEQKAQEMYSEFVQATTASIEADRAAIAEKEQESASTSEEISETEAAQLANGEELQSATDLMKAHHLECDFVMKYFDVRQKARSEEMESIEEAKSILSGANFGQPEEESQEQEE